MGQKSKRLKEIFDQLSEEESVDTRASLSRWILRLYSADARKKEAPTDSEIQQSYLDYLEEKYK